jgi:hypothetical protein
LKALQNVPPILEELANTIHAHLVDEPPILLKEGGLIRRESMPC